MTFNKSKRKHAYDGITLNKSICILLGFSFVLKTF